MKRAAWALALLAAAGHAAERPPETRAERSAIEGIANAIEHRDCKLAVERLNEGLAAKHLGVFLLAGTMYEEGVCLKANWERAQKMYERAGAGGHQGGYYKLVAGLAYQGRDPAAAVWWAQQTKRLGPPADCAVPDGVHKDAERYVATLRAWPAGRLAACAYTVGVLAMVAGDAEYPRLANLYYITGKVTMTFTPAQGTMEWVTTEVDLKPIPGLSTGETQLDRSSRASRDMLRKYLQDVGERALRRYERPMNVDPQWRFRADYVFTIE